MKFRSNASLWVKGRSRFLLPFGRNKAPICITCSKSALLSVQYQDGRAVVQELMELINVTILLEMYEVPLQRFVTVKVRFRFLAPFRRNKPPICIICSKSATLSVQYQDGGASCRNLVDKCDDFTWNIWNYTLTLCNGWKTGSDFYLRLAVIKLQSVSSVPKLQRYLSNTRMVGRSCRNLVDKCDDLTWNMKFHSNAL
jgi:hypothetical protein